MFWKRRAKEAARVGHWKWIRNESGTYLFDLSQDVEEKKNLADEMPEKTEEMHRQFTQWQQEMQAAEPRGPFRDF
jgi:hypothetical protein